MNPSSSPVLKPTSIGVGGSIATISTSNFYNFFFKCLQLRYYFLGTHFNDQAPIYFGNIWLLPFNTWQLFKSLICSCRERRTDEFYMSTKFVALIARSLLAVPRDCKQTRPGTGPSRWNSGKKGSRLTVPMPSQSNLLPDCGGRWVPSPTGLAAAYSHDVRYGIL